MENQPVQDHHNQTIKADREVILKIKKIAHDEERNIQTITNRVLKLGLKEYPKVKSISI